VDTIERVPIYDYECGSCGERFEELVGPHVGLKADQVKCPACGATGVERRTPSNYAPIHRRMTAGQKRRLEASRGIDRGGAKERFKRQRAAERRSGRRGR
jgi:putative FmdB family regulatory protein